MGVWVAARPIRATRPSQPRPYQRPRASASRTLQVGTLLLGRKYSFLEYVASAGLVTGIVFFTMGDAEARPSFNPIGIVLTLTLALALALALARTLARTLAVAVALALTLNLTLPRRAPASTRSASCSSSSVSASTPPRATTRHAPPPASPRLTLALLPHRHA